jgi:hypothetical protein
LYQEKWTAQHSKSPNWKLWAATTGRQDFSRNSVEETFFRTLRSSSGVKMKEIEDVYFFALCGNGQLSRDMCFNWPEREYQTVAFLSHRYAQGQQSPDHRWGRSRNLKLGPLSLAPSILSTPKPLHTPDQTAHWQKMQNEADFKSPLFDYSDIWSPRLVSRHCWYSPSNAWTAWSIRLRRSLATIRRPDNLWFLNSASAVKFKIQEVRIKALKIRNILDLHKRLCIHSAAKCAIQIRPGWVPNGQDFKCVRHRQQANHCSRDSNELMHVNRSSFLSSYSYWHQKNQYWWQNC